MFLGAGHRRIRLGRFGEALSDLNRSFELDPYGFNTGYLRALTLYLSGRFDVAAGEYERLMELSRDEKALELARKGKVPGDLRHAMLIASDLPARIAFTSWFYRALRRTGRDENAARLFETVEEGLLPLRLKKSSTPEPSRGRTRTSRTTGSSSSTAAFGRRKKFSIVRRSPASGPPWRTGSRCSTSSKDGGTGLSRSSSRSSPSRTGRASATWPPRPTSAVVTCRDDE
jgi:hypothetical protein